MWLRRSNRCIYSRRKPTIILFVFVYALRREPFKTFSGYLLACRKKQVVEREIGARQLLEKGRKRPFIKQKTGMISIFASRTYAA